MTYLQILSKSFLLNLATVDSNKHPWASPVIHVQDERIPALHWLSNTLSKHSKNITLSTLISCSATFVTGPGQHKIGVQMTGFAHELEGYHHDLTAKLWNKSGERALQNPVEAVGKDTWWTFFPITIEVFDEDSEQKEITHILDQAEIDSKIKLLNQEGFPVTFLWYDRPGTIYTVHKHIKQVKFFVLHGSVTFTLQDGSTKQISTGDEHTETVGAVHSALVGEQGSVFLVGQVDQEEVSIYL
jgi:uncharacterized protein YhbP (UPF0306 family)